MPRLAPEAPVLDENKNREYLNREYLNREYLNRDVGSV